MDQGEYKRVYLFQERPGDGGPRGVFTYSLPRFGSTMGEVESIPAAALVSRPSQYGKNIHLDNQVGPAMIHPAQLATKGPAWSELFDGGVKQAPIVGVTLQILEQVMYLSINLSVHLSIYPLSKCIQKTYSKKIGKLIYNSSTPKRKQIHAVNLEKVI